MNIIDRKARLKARRLVRKQKRQAEALAVQADDDINRLFLKRFSRLFAVRRFVIVWTLLVFMLGAGAMWQVRGMDVYYLTTSPVSGGVYREGIVGAFTNANPLFATSSVDASVSRLLFSGLFKVSPNGDVVNDLATDLQIDDQAKVYTVSLRNDVTWHDGEPFDADDVLFTYNAIKNPAVRSPLRSSWRGVEVTKVDQYTIQFELPNALSSFRLALVNGIVPEHILSEEDPEDLRSASFNTIEAIGTGPFTLRTLEVDGIDADTRQERIALARNDTFHDVVPGLDSVVIRAYRTEDAMLKDFEERIIQSMVGLTSVSETLLEMEDVTLINAPLASSVMVFMNNSVAALSDAKVRQALSYATDVEDIQSSLGFRAVPSNSPFLRSQFAYDPDIVQVGFDVEKANQLLDEAGWVRGEDGMRTKDGQPLRLRLVSQSLSEYAVIAQRIQEDWDVVGVRVEAILQPEEDIQAGAIARHDYDVLLYGISIGYDPDVFAYWHSSQADPNSPTRLNLSEYKNDIADEALEAGRTRVDEELRKVKYTPFLAVWRDEAPAVALYQPRFLMVVRGTFEGFENGQLSSATDRYWSISDWRVRNAQVVK